MLNHGYPGRLVHSGVSREDLCLRANSYYLTGTDVRSY